MRIAKYTYPPTVLIFSLGLLYSQVCGVICSISNCSAPAQVARPAKVEKAGHCHQHQPSSQQKQPSDNSHGCPGHHSAASILPVETISTAVTHHVWQLAPAELVYSFEVLFEPAGSDTDRAGRFRAPPRLPRLTVLRI
jgi:hypothetical protein